MVDPLVKLESFAHAMNAAVSRLKSAKAGHDSLFQYENPLPVLESHTPLSEGEGTRHKIIQRVYQFLNKQALTPETGRGVRVWILRDFPNIDFDLWEQDVIADIEYGKDSEDIVVLFESEKNQLLTEKSYSGCYASMFTSTDDRIRFLPFLHGDEDGQKTAKLIKDLYVLHMEEKPALFSYPQGMPL